MKKRGHQWLSSLSGLAHQLLLYSMKGKGGFGKNRLFPDDTPDYIRSLGPCVLLGPAEDTFRRSQAF